MSPAEEANRYVVLVFKIKFLGALMVNVVILATVVLEYIFQTAPQTQISRVYDRRWFL